MLYVNNSDTVVLVVEILLATALLLYFFSRRKPGAKEERHAVQRVEIKLKGTLTPSEIQIKIDQPAQLVIHRLDEHPIEELFEIEELEIYEILPALHATIIAFTPHKRGRFPIILGGEQNAGIIAVE
jgi:plastocyanin domain-containing protein